jgi:exodeoxyribonuclease VII small subunit
VGGVKFEQAMARLEAIVGELEKGDLPLDESLKIFEEGIRLSKSCLKILDRNGKKRLHAFSPDEEAEESADESSC